MQRAFQTLLKRIPNAAPLSSHASVYPSINYLTGIPDPTQIEQQLATNGYCLFRETGLETVSDLIDFHVPRRIFSSYLNEPRESNFEALQNEIFASYQHGTDDRKGYGSNLLDVSAGAPSTNWVSHHNELAYTDTLPRIIAFVCLETDSFSQGYTPIANSIDVERNLDPVIKSKLLKYGVRYLRKLHDDDGKYGKTWKKMFHVDNQEDAERVCDYLGYKYQWTNDGCLCLDYVRPAFIECCDRNELSFVNSMLGMHGSTLDNVKEYENVPYHERPYHASYGNGEEFTKEELKYVHDLHTQHELVFQWNVGDVLILDNLHWSHARYPYSGERKMVAMIGLPLVRTPMVHKPFGCEYELNLKQSIDQTLHQIIQDNKYISQDNNVTNIINE